VKSTAGVELNPDWLFDIQVKRNPRVQASAPQRVEHRHAIPPAEAEPELPDSTARVRLRWKGRAGVLLAKRIIKLIYAVGETVNNDPEVQPVPQGCVRAELQRAECPPDLPGRRPFGTDFDRGQGGFGHRKHEVHAQRCADHRTLDGANVEMREEAGAENFFLFGLTEDEVETVKRDGYRPSDYVNATPSWRRARPHRRRHVLPR